MASRRKQRKDGIHFVNARPTSEMERLDAQRLVRAHVGRWISDQTRDRDRPDPLPIDPHSPLHPKPEPDDFGLPRALPFHSPYDASRPRSASPKPELAIELGFRSPEHQVTLQWEDARSRSRSPFLSPDSDSSDSSGDDTISITRDHSPTMTWTPDSSISPQFTGLLDPFNQYPIPFRISPTSVDSCQQYCLNVLWPGIVPGGRGRDKFNALALHSKPQQWFSLSRSDPTLFAAFMFASLCHQRVMWLNSWNSIQFGPAEDKLLRMCERDSIRLINEAVQDPARMNSDAVLLSVICMAHHRAPDNSMISQLQSTPFNPPLQRLQWLDAYGCLKPNEVHIRGLVELIRMRGGLRNIRLPGLAATISFSEIFAAAVWCIQPIFEFWPLDERSTGLTVQELLGFGPCDIQQGFGQLQVIGFTPQMAEAFQAARAYITIIQPISKTHDNTEIPRNPNLNATTLTDQRNITEYSLLKLPAASTILSYFSHQNQATTYEACRLAVLVFGVAIIFPIPAQNSPLHRLARNIKDILRRNSAFSLWHVPATKVPLTWILVLGGIAATGLPEREFFVLALASVARIMGFNNWVGVRCVLREMIWHESAAEFAGRVLWDEVMVKQAAGAHIWDQIVSSKGVLLSPASSVRTVRGDAASFSSLTP